MSILFHFMYLIFLPFSLPIFHPDGTFSFQLINRHKSLIWHFLPSLDLFALIIPYHHRCVRYVVVLYCVCYVIGNVSMNIKCQPPINLWNHLLKSIHCGGSKAIHPHRMRNQPNHRYRRHAIIPRNHFRSHHSSPWLDFFFFLRPNDKIERFHFLVSRWRTDDRFVVVLVNIVTSVQYSRDSRSVTSYHSHRWQTESFFKLFFF